MRELYSAKQLKITIYLAVIFTILLGLTASSHAAVITVINNNDSGAGSFRQALADAVNGDTITFSLAGCPCSITMTSAGFENSKNLTIQGPGARLLTLDGNGG